MRVMKKSKLALLIATFIVGCLCAPTFADVCTLPNPDWSVPCDKMIGFKANGDRWERQSWDCYNWFFGICPCYVVSCWGAGGPLCDPTIEPGCCYRDNCMGWGMCPCDPL